MLSYFVNFERKSNLFDQKLDHVSIDLVMNRVKRLRHVKDNIQKIQYKSEEYINKKQEQAS